MKSPIIKYAPEGDDRLISWRYLEEAKIMSQYIKDGDIIFDVGANICDHSIFFGLNFPNSKIIAFEPIKSFCEMAEKNIKENGLTNVEVMQYGLGQKEETLQISVNNEGSSLVQDHGTNVENVSIKIGDDVKALSKVNVLKIDVEGFELEAMNGLKSVIETNLPVVILEIHPQFVTMIHALKSVSFLKEQGYLLKKCLNRNEYVFEHSSKTNEEQVSEKELKNNLLLLARICYDRAKTKSERKQFVKDYKVVNYFGKPIDRWLIWSRLYVFFTFKFTN